VHLSISAEKAGTYVDVDNVALFDDVGRNLIKNGDFSIGHAWWYFSSDRHHLPWHAKNLLLHLLFEQGWLGLVLVSSALFYALREFARRALRGDLLATAPLAALAGTPGGGHVRQPARRAASDAADLSAVVPVAGGWNGAQDARTALARLRLRHTRGSSGADSLRTDSPARPTISPSHTCDIEYDVDH
jgi:hypothetical protein